MVTEAAVTDRGKYKCGTVSNLHSRETQQSSALHTAKVSVTNHLPSIFHLQIQLQLLVLPTSPTESWLTRK